MTKICEIKRFLFPALYRLLRNASIPCRAPNAKNSGAQNSTGWETRCATGCATKCETRLGFGLLRNFLPALCRNSLAVIIFLAVYSAGCGGQNPDELFRQAVNAAANAQWTETEKLTDKILAVDDDHVRGRILHGISLYELQHPEEAESVLAQAAENAPEDFNAQYFYGWVLFETEQYADALRPLKNAYEVRKDQPDLLIMLATCCLEQNLTEGLRYLQALRRFKTYREDPKVYNDMALLWLGRPHLDKAEQLLMQAYRMDPRNPATLQNVAVFYDRYVQDYKQAVKYYQLCLRESRRRHQYSREANVKRRLQQLTRELRTTVTN